jgi:hypothetical protein
MNHSVSQISNQVALSELWEKWGEVAYNCASVYNMYK